VIDLHTHLLPNVDDGATDVRQAVAVLTKFAELGVTAVCCTPHLRASHLDEAPCEEMDALMDDLRAVAPAAPRLTRGFEIMLDVPNANFADRCLGLGGTQYVLVEFGRLVPADGSVDVLSRMTAQGVVPLLAHPERYAVCSVVQAARWREAGALLQVDATTLLADTRRAGRARALVEAGCATIIASDNHGDQRNLQVAVEWLESHGGRTQAQLLAVENPAAILAGEIPAPVPAMRLRRSWYSMLKEFVAGGAEA
jgi:protein-tyrosine phosphatase